MSKKNYGSGNTKITRFDKTIVIDKDGEIAALKEENRKLREALEQVRICIIENAEDTLWFADCETCVDFIDGVLANEPIADSSQGEK